LECEEDEMTKTKRAHAPQDRAKLVDEIRDYWDARTLGVQYVSNPSLQRGTREYFDNIRPWMNPYKFPWIMDRIEYHAERLKAKHLLEIGCGMGFDSLEFLKRGVRVTATDLTPSAVKTTKEHFALEGVHAEDVREANALDLPFPDETFDAVWSNGVLHATGDTPLAIREVWRVLKPGGVAIISHFYRKPSWLYTVSRLGRENIEHRDSDPPINEFYTDEQILEMFKDFKVIAAEHEHHRALPVAKSGLKAALYTYGFRPLYNLLPEGLALRFAYKLSVTAVKP
jgi:ubiquinone/menaquinone biosynthesis C-methylase UbiE